MFLFLFKKKTIRPLKILLDIKDLMVMGGGRLPGEQRTVLHHFVDLTGDPGADSLVRGMAEDRVDHIDNHLHVTLFQTTGGDGRRTDAQT